MWISQERKELSGWKKRHFSLFLQCFQLSEIVSDLRVGLLNTLNVRTKIWRQQLSGYAEFGFIVDYKYINRDIQNPVKQVFCENSWRLKTVNYIRKMFHLRCLNRFSICPWYICLLGNHRVVLRKNCH